MAYLGKTPSQAVRSRYYFTATGGETSLSGADDNSKTLVFADGNYVDVTLNGVTLVAGTDYNTTTANTIGGLTALTASDVVEVVVYDTFSVFSGNVNSDFTVGGSITTDGLTTTGDINFGDNDKAQFGAGSDLQIYHTGSTSIIKDAGTGNLAIQAEDFAVQSSDGSATHIYVDTSTGYTSLGFGGSTKINTTSTGVDVTGTVTADGLTVEGSSSTTTGITIQANTNGINKSIDFTNTSDAKRIGIEYDNPTGKLRLVDRNEDKILDIDEFNGDISFYDSTGVTQGLFWDASTQRLGLGTTNPESIVELETTSSTTFSASDTSGQSTSGATLAVQNLSDTDNTFSQILFRNRNTSKAVSRIASLTNSTGTQLAFVTENSGTPAERMRITSGGSVGIGTASPSSSHRLTLDSPSNYGGIQLKQSGTQIGQIIQEGGTGTVYIDADSAGTGGALILRTNGGSERMRIASNGNVGIGTSSPAGTIHARKTSDNATLASVGSSIVLNHQSGTYTSGNYYNVLGFAKANSNGGTLGASIAPTMDGTGQTEALTFGVASGGSQVAERMRIDSSGSVTITSGGLQAIGVYNNTTGTGANLVVDSAGGFARSTSSLRYKNTVNDATHGLTELLALRSVTYKGNNDGDTVFGGLIAEEVHDAGLTEFVTYNEDGEPDALAYGNMVSLCIKAIQEQQATITALEARIAALENA